MFCTIFLSGVIYGQEKQTQTKLLRNSALKVFIDCHYCDRDYIKREIPFTNYVRDRKEAQVHVMVTSRDTGSGYSVIHAVSVSIPRLSEVIAYEKNDPQIKKKIKSGYPRFITHPLIIRIQQLLHVKYGLDENKELVLISSHLAAEELFSFLGNRFDVIDDQSILAIIFRTTI